MTTKEIMYIDHTFCKMRQIGFIHVLLFIIHVNGFSDESLIKLESLTRHTPPAYHENGDLYAKSKISVHEFDVPMFEYPADDIISSCTAFIDAFSEAAANYTRCALIYARPLRFCQQCVEHYERSKLLYNIIMKGNPLNDEGDLCSNMILNSDRVQIIVRTGLFMEKLWEDCDCNNCFEYLNIKNDTMVIKLANLTERFNRLANNTLECFSAHSNVTADGRVVLNSTVCRDCLSLYKSLNNLYEKIEKDTGHHVCMDVVDVMNSTRSLWSSVYKCNLDPGSLWPVLVLSGFFCLLPVLFYTGTRIHGARVQSNLIRQRRLRDVLSGGQSIGSTASTPQSPLTSTTSAQPT